MNKASDKPAQSIILLSKELQSRGYVCEDRQIDGLPYKACVAPNGHTWLTRTNAAQYPFMTDKVRAVSDDKHVAYEFAERHGVRIPHTLAVNGTPSKEIDSFLAANVPVIVKPLDGRQSRGLTLNIRTREELDAAIEAAREYSHDVLIQEYVVGDEIRMMVLDGKVVSAVLRQAPQVIGDGTSTLEQLIIKENEQRTKLTFEYLAYPKLEAPLIDESLVHSQTVPAKDEVVKLGQASMIKKGASFYGITNELHQDYKDVAVQLANALNPEFLIVDILVADYAAPLTNDTYAFLEFNASPALQAYYCVRGGDVFDAVKVLADKIDRSLMA